jgi:hypothetical protein
MASHNEILYACLTGVHRNPALHLGDSDETLAQNALLCLKTELINRSLRSISIILKFHGQIMLKYR